MNLYAPRPSQQQPTSHGSRPAYERPALHHETPPDIIDADALNPAVPASSAPAHTIPHPHHAVTLPIQVVPIQPEHFIGLETVQQLAFPTLTDEEHLSAAKFAHHITLFPEGQFVALAEVRPGTWIPVGSTSTYRTDYEFGNRPYTFMESMGDGWITGHQPYGEWLYGIDVSVHPEFRGMRIGRRLYEARHKLVTRLNLRGEIAGGMIPGYDQYRDTLSIAQYVMHVHQSRLHDATLTMQLHNGFQVRGILYDHISDPRSDNACTLIIRDNPHYQSPGG
ncbi:MAG: GNAT family N-acetyltransferase [Chloroflexota bacterium]|nr:GNAT family N-acetyltransferase [Chloroflexota bacterium]